MSYKIRDKKKRNQEIWEYYQANSDHTMREIGEHFGISGARVHVILKGFKSETKQDKDN